MKQQLASFFHTLNPLYTLAPKLGQLAKFVIKNICDRSTVTVRGKEKLLELASKESCILVGWHEHIALLDFWSLPPPHKTVVVIDSHYCGTIASGLGAFSETFVTSHRLTKRRVSLHQLCRRLKKEPLIAYFAVDGPTGPIRKVKPGSIFLAKKNRIKIVPCSFAATRFWDLPLWTRLCIPKPNSTIGIVFGEPLDVSARSLEEGAIALEERLNNLEKEAYGYLHSGR